MNEAHAPVRQCGRCGTHRPPLHRYPVGGILTPVCSACWEGLTGRPYAEQYSVPGAFTLTKRDDLDIAKFVSKVGGGPVQLKWDTELWPGVGCA